MKQFLLQHKNNTWFWAFFVASLSALVAILIMSQDAGISGDEFFHNKHAKDVYNWYSSAGKDTVAVTVTEQNNLPTYGQAVDNFAYAIYHWTGIDAEMQIRHLVCSFFGWLAMLFTALIGFRLTKKWRPALIILALMFFSPRFLGHSFNNLKDLPFATAMVMGLYYIIAFIQDFPKVKKSVMVMLAVSIGFAIAVRIGGLLLIAFFGLFALVMFISKYKVFSIWRKPNNKLFGKLLLWGVVIVVAGYLLALLLWPYALISPVKNPKFVLSYMSQFATAIRQLFEGTLQWSDMLPWRYTPKFILMTIPIAVIIGFLLYPFIGGWKKENRLNTFMIYFAFIFPVFWIVYSNANVYGGWRHAMFAYPPMVAAAGLGFNVLIEKIQNLRLKEKNNSTTLNSKLYTLYATLSPFAIALPFLLLIMPATHIIRNHPYEYLYFNELAGGIKKAYGNYELDYYYHSTREATEWVIKNAEKSGLETGNKIRVASWHTASVGYFLRNDTAKFQNAFSRWYEKGNNDWDYAIFVITGMAPEQIKNRDVFPPKNCVHTITVDGEPICIILKRTDKSDMLGFKAKEAHQNDTAVFYLEKAIALDPTNEAALANISEIYLQTGQLEKAKTTIDMLLKVSPKYETGNFFLAHYYLMQNKLDDALAVCKQIIKDNFKFRAAYNLVCNIYLRKQDVKSAEKILLKMIDADQMDEQGMQQLFEIYKAEGIGERAAYKKVMKKFYQSLERRGKKKEAATYHDQYDKL